MSPERTVQVQFICEVPRHHEVLFTTHHRVSSSAFNIALLNLFGLPIGTVTEFRARYTERYQLVEVNSTIGHPRVPDPLEIQGLFLGVSSALFVALMVPDALVAVNLKGARDHDA